MTGARIIPWNSTATTLADQNHNINIISISWVVTRLAAVTSNRCVLDKYLCQNWCQCQTHSTHYSACPDTCPQIRFIWLPFIFSNPQFLNIPLLLSNKSIGIKWYNVHNRFSILTNLYVHQYYELWFLKKLF